MVLARTMSPLPGGRLRRRPDPGSHAARGPHPQDPHRHRAAQKHLLHPSSAGAGLTDQ